MKILILGGTEEARQLAGELVARGHAVTTSLAGRTSQPLALPGEVRSGPFGGAEALADYLRKQSFERLVDAGHPFAAQMAANAVAAATLAGIPLVRLHRPPWREPPRAHWLHAADAEAAAALLPPGARALLTVGHTRLDAYFRRDDCSFVVRSIEPPSQKLPATAQSLLARPPFYIGGETALLQQEAITHLVTKNAGGVQTEAKLRAAQQLGIPVIMIARPTLPEAHEAPTVGRALAALHLERG